MPAAHDRHFAVSLISTARALVVRVTVGDDAAVITFPHDPLALPHARVHPRAGVVRLSEVGVDPDDDDDGSPVSLQGL
jgi:hypothetical protein